MTERAAALSITTPASGGASELPPEDLAVAALYLAAGGHHDWATALESGCALFGAGRADLAILERGAAAPRRIAAVARDGSADRTPASSADPASGSEDGLHAAVLLLPVDHSRTAVVAFRWSGQHPNEQPNAPAIERWAQHLALALRSSIHPAFSPPATGLIQALLEAMPQATWVVDRQRKVVLANHAAGQALQRAATSLGLRHGCLVARTAEHEKAMAAAFQGFTVGPSNHSVTLDLRRDRSGAPALLHLGALGADPSCNSAPILVSLFDSAAPPPSYAPQVLAALGLTVAESRVAMLLAQGHCPEEIAALQGVRITTIRTQLAHVFHKLGAERQAQVIRLLCQHESLWRRMAA